MKILIADDHSIVRKGLIGLLRHEFAEAQICEAGDGATAIEYCRKKTYDLILLDISMPGRNGIETLKQLRLDGIKTPILMLSMHSEDQYAVRSLKAGASGFVNKDSATEELILAVHKVLSGKKYISPKASEELINTIGDINEQPSHHLLSERELQVFVLIASGKEVSGIAEELSLSVNTISTYRTRILEKLKLNSNAAITRYALDNNLI